MTSLLRIFSIVFFSLCLVFVVFVFRDSTFKGNHIKQIENITMLTKLPGISLSTSFLENRIHFYDDNSNKFYLNMDADIFTEFVYVK